MKILFWTILLCLPCMMAQAKLQIAAHGRARCTIVTQPGATPAERFAAQELAETLKQITGATFPVVEREKDLPGSVLLVGPGPAAEALFPEVALERFGGEQLTIRTRGKNLLLAGGRPLEVHVENRQRVNVPARQRPQLSAQQTGASGREAGGQAGGG